jgi:hypothetical protein
LQIGIGGDLQNAVICIDADQTILVAALHRAAQDRAIIEGREVAGWIWNSAGNCDGIEGALGTGQAGCDEV